jgi:hypothetical protein
MSIEILDRTLHKLSLEEIKDVRQLADTLFVRLVRPFKQSRVEREFDFHATIRAAMRTGQLLPTYIRAEKSHPKSKLVIAMSMSGIDRCFAVGLIPLLAQLKRYLDFHLYIYTDDLVEAKFSQDGFLENDCDIAWNNVLAPCVFNKLADIPFDSQETKLLLIDSLGGRDSEWYRGVNKDTLKEARDAQRRFVGEGNPWTEVREWLDGRYSEFENVPRKMLPLNWEDKVVRNTEKRWVETPALREYLIRYIFNPRFGEKLHGQETLLVGDDYNHVKVSFQRVREKFKTIHLLTPSFNEESEEILNLMKKSRFIDFHHKADSLEGFAQTLIGIVYGRETNRITTPTVQFAKYFESSEGDLGDNEERGHSELSKTFRDCFHNCERIENYLPKVTHTFTKRERGTSNIVDIEIPYSNIEARTAYAKAVETMPEDWTIDPMWSDFGKVRKAQEILEYIKTHRVIWSDLWFEMRDKKNDDRKELSDMVEYERHHTRAMKKHVEDGLSLYDSYYDEWFYVHPLKNVVWCTTGKFKADVMGISAAPADPVDRQRAVIFHEQAHWAEHVCPAIGVFTNAVLTYLVGERETFVPVSVGEYALDVQPPHTPWIVDYAGKWYRRYDKMLPNPTELFSVHAEYFHSPEALVPLLDHDPKMVKAIAFIYMGGPLALLENLVMSKKEEADEEINRREQRSRSYGERRGRGGRRKKEVRDDYKPSSTPNPTVEEHKSFGI